MSRSRNSSYSSAAVYRALAEDLAHPTADSVFSRLSRQLPGLSQATIYRTLQFFESENLIRKVSSPGAIGRFDASVDPHQHLVCRVEVSRTSRFRSCIRPRFQRLRVSRLKSWTFGL